MQYLVEQLEQAGAPASAIRFDRAHQRSDHGGQVGNLVCKLPGTVRAPRRLLMAHADTVALAEGARPVRRGRWIVPADKHTGLGADDRTGCAVVLSAALDVLRSGRPHPPLTFLWTVQEEIGLYGARLLSLGLLGKPRLAFNFDGGSAEKLTVGATGGYRMTIRIEGIAAHAGNTPEQGVSALTVASLAIARLHREGWLGSIAKGRRRGTSNIGVAHGGHASNVVMPELELKAEARSHDPKFRRQIVRAIEQAFRQAAEQVTTSQGKRGSVSFDGRLDYESFRLADDDPSLLAAEVAVQDAGGTPHRAISNGGVDANWLFARGIATVTLGSGQSSPHTVAERVVLDEFRMACRVAARLTAVG